jgi:hypothetical protein
MLPILLTLDEVSKRLNISVPSARTIAKKIGCRIGRSWRISEEALARYQKSVAARKVQQNDKARKTRRRGWLRRKYGLTSSLVEIAFTLQDWKCAICRRATGQKWCVDHDHKTGKPRGVLCDPCNRGIGFLKDDPEILRRAAEYVESGGGEAAAALTQGCITPEAKKAAVDVTFRTHRSEKPNNFVPRGGIEPPTRGFSVRDSLQNREEE